MHFLTRARAAVIAAAISGLVGVAWAAGALPTPNFAGLQINGNTMTFPGAPATIVSQAGLNTALPSTAAVYKGTGGSGVAQAATPGTDYAAPGSAMTVSALYTFTNSDFAMLGSSTGTTTFTSSNAGSSNFTLTFPAVTETLAGLGAADQTLSGGANLTPYNPATGNYTVDCGKNPGQWITNGGAFTITAPASDGECILQIENGASAGAVTWSGFSEGTNTGDALTTTNTSKFQVSITRIHAISHYLITALQ